MGAPPPRRAPEIASGALAAGIGEVLALADRPGCSGHGGSSRRRAREEGDGSGDREERKRHRRRHGEGREGREHSRKSSRREHSDREGALQEAAKTWIALVKHLDRLHQAASFLLSVDLWAHSVRLPALLSPCGQAHCTRL